LNKSSSMLHWRGTATSSDDLPLQMRDLKFFRDRAAVELDAFPTSGDLKLHTYIALPKDITGWTQMVFRIFDYGARGWDLKSDNKLAIPPIVTNMLWLKACMSRIYTNEGSFFWPDGRKESRVTERTQFIGVTEPKSISLMSTSCRGRDDPVRITVNCSADVSCAELHDLLVRDGKWLPVPDASISIPAFCLAETLVFTDKIVYVDGIEQLAPAEAEFIDIERMSKKKLLIEGPVAFGLRLISVAGSSGRRSPPPSGHAASLPAGAAPPADDVVGVAPGGIKFVKASRAKSAVRVAPR